jgi:hypothetical protein
MRISATGGVLSISTRLVDDAVSPLLSIALTRTCQIPSGTTVGPVRVFQLFPIGSLITVPG